MRELLPNLYTAFTNPEPRETVADIAKPGTPRSRDPAAKESVLEQINQDRQAKKSAGKQKQPKTKNPKKNGQEL
jgi:hypothetical protein